MEQTHVEYSAFIPEKGVCEYHTLIHITDTSLSFEKQLEAIWDTYKTWQSSKLTDATPVFIRLFLSDIANQQTLAETRMAGMPCPCSIIGQPPLDGSKIAAWIYWQTDASVSVVNKRSYKVSHGTSYTHHWSVGCTDDSENSHEQTRNMLDKYAEELVKNGLSLSENCIRTWFFVQNVDVNYQGVVKGRNEVFDRQGLTRHTHFIASTGIGGRVADKRHKVSMDCYAIGGIQPEQIHFLYAPTHLNPTYEYGVSFERGTYVDYADRRQVFISGTASINNKGEIMYPGQIDRQTDRMLENVKTLLHEADCGFEDVGCMIIYLRDIADYATVSSIFRKRFPLMPKVFLWAPVCRPGWLVEMECIASKKRTEKRFSPF